MQSFTDWLITSRTNLTPMRIHSLLVKCSSLHQSGPWGSREIQVSSTRPRPHFQRELLHPLIHRSDRGEISVSALHVSPPWILCVQSETSPWESSVADFPTYSSSGPGPASLTLHSSTESHWGLRPPSSWPVFQHHGGTMTIHTSSPPVNSEGDSQAKRVPCNMASPFLTPPTILLEISQSPSIHHDGGSFIFWSVSIIYITISYIIFKIRVIMIS